MFRLYRMTHKETGQFYVGSTNKDLKKYMSSCKKWKEFMLEEGRKEFLIEVLQENEDEEIIRNAEYDLIKISKQNPLCWNKGNQKACTSKIALERVEAGTNPFAGELGSKLQKERIANGTNPFAGELGSKLQKERIANGTHNFVGELGSKLNRERVAAGTHNLVGELGSKLARENALKRVANGTHPSQIKKVCPYCQRLYSINNIGMHIKSCKQI